VGRQKESHRPLYGRMQVKTYGPTSSRRKGRFSAEMMASTGTTIFSLVEQLPYHKAYTQGGQKDFIGLRLHAGEDRRNQQG
jgi:hypothetical protein